MAPFLFGEVMKFQYIDNGNESPDKIVFMGVLSFTKNHKGVEVSDEKMIKKLLGNPSFRVLQDEPKTIKTKKTQH